MSPHPDDETLISGGLIARLTDRSAPVWTVAVTDGEAAYPDVAPAALASRRRQEQGSALRALGADPSRVIRLCKPDGHVARTEDELARRLGELIEQFRIELVVAPWQFDHHCDHEATGRSAATAATRAGIAIVHGIFWGYLHTRPGRLGARRLVRLELSDDERRRKETAIRAHRSQVTEWLTAPVLGADELAVTRWPFEVFVAGART